MSLLTEYEMPRRKYKKIYEMNESEYTSLKNIGMFWEWYPEATGLYLQDKEISENGGFAFENR